MFNEIIQGVNCRFHDLSQRGILLDEDIFPSYVNKSGRGWWGARLGSESDSRPVLVFFEGAELARRLLKAHDEPPGCLPPDEADAKIEKTTKSLMPRSPESHPGT